MRRGNETIKCAMRMGLANVLCEWDYPMCPGNGTIQCVLERKQANVLSKWD